MRQKPRFNGTMVGPRVDLRRVASSHLPDDSFAYKYRKDGPETSGGL